MYRFCPSIYILTENGENNIDKQFYSSEGKTWQSPFTNCILIQCKEFEILCKGQKYHCLKLQIFHKETATPCSFKLSLSKDSHTY